MPTFKSIQKILTTENQSLYTAPEQGGILVNFIFASEQDATVTLEVKHGDVVTNVLYETPLPFGSSFQTEKIFLEEGGEVYARANVDGSVSVTGSILETDITYNPDVEVDSIPLASGSTFGKVKLDDDIESSRNADSGGYAATPYAVSRVNAKIDTALSIATTSVAGRVMASTLVPVDSSTGAMSVALGSYGSTFTGSTVVANTSVSCPSLVLNGWTVTVSS